MGELRINYSYRETSKVTVKVEGNDMWMSEISEKGEKEPPVWGDRHVRYIVPYMATLPLLI